MKPNVQKSVSAAFVLFFLAAISSPGEVQSRKLSIETSVFYIPAIQTITWGGPAEDGTIRGVTKGGDVTAPFPEGVVLLQAAADASDGDLIEIIKKKVYFACSDVLQIFPTRRRAFIYDPSTRDCDSIDVQETIQQRGHNFRYHLTVNPVLFLDSDFIVSVKFTSAFFPPPQETFNASPIEIPLLSQTLGLEPGRTYLIGFPRGAVKGSRRGTVFWVALSMKP